MRNTSARGTTFSSHTFALRKELGPANRGGFHEQVPRYVLNSDGQRLVLCEHADKMVDELRLHCAGTQHIELPGTFRHRRTCSNWPNGYESNAPAITVALV